MAADDRSLKAALLPFVAGLLFGLVLGLLAANAYQVEACLHAPITQEP